MQLTGAQRDVISKLQKGFELVQYTSGQFVKIFDGYRSEKVRLETLESLLEKGFLERVKVKESYDKFKLIKDIKLRKK